MSTSMFSLADKHYKSSFYLLEYELFDFLHKGVRVEKKNNLNKMIFVFVTKMEEKL